MFIWTFSSLEFDCHVLLIDKGYTAIASKKSLLTYILGHRIRDINARVNETLVYW